MKFEFHCLFVGLYYFHYTLIKCDDKLTLGPVQLMELILKEQSKSKAQEPIHDLSDGFKSCAAHQPARKLRTNIVSDLDSYLHEDLVNDDEENEVLQQSSNSLSGHEELGIHIHQSGSAKVWGDWSEWSKCNATCGAGVSSRSRVCVAGDCAPFECEERIRPCSDQPC